MESFRANEVDGAILLHLTQENIRIELQVERGSFHFVILFYFCSFVHLFSVTCNQTRGCESTLRSAVNGDWTEELDRVGL